MTTTGSPVQAAKTTFEIIDTLRELDGAGVSNRRAPRYADQYHPRPPADPGERGVPHQHRRDLPRRRPVPGAGRTGPKPDEGVQGRPAGGREPGRGHRRARQHDDRRARPRRVPLQGPRLRGRPARHPRGQARPLQTTAMGKSILAHRPRAKRSRPSSTGTASPDVTENTITDRAEFRSTSSTRSATAATPSTTRNESAASAASLRR